MKTIGSLGISNYFNTVLMEYKVPYPDTTSDYLTIGVFVCIQVILLKHILKKKISWFLPFFVFTFPNLNMFLICYCLTIFTPVVLIKFVLIKKCMRSACGPLTKNKERIKKIKETGDSRYIYIYIYISKRIT